MGAITPAGFNLLSSSLIENDLELPISSNAVTIGDMLELDVGAVSWTDADASTEYWQLKAIATETVTSAATVVKATLVVSLGQMFSSETVGSSAAADNNDRMILTDANTVNNTGTDSAAQTAVVIQFAPMFDATDKRIKSWIVPGVGVNPDAT